MKCIICTRAVQMSPACLGTKVLRQVLSVHISKCAHHCSAAEVLCTLRVVVLVSKWAHTNVLPCSNTQVGFSKVLMLRTGCFRFDWSILSTIRVNILTSLDSRKIAELWNVLLGCLSMHQDLYTTLLVLVTDLYQTITFQFLQTVFEAMQSDVSLDCTTVKQFWEGALVHKSLRHLNVLVQMELTQLCISFFSACSEQTRRHQYQIYKEKYKKNRKKN